MCGIAGYAGPDLISNRTPEELRAMCGAIRHRGPDEEGTFVGDAVALGMRRLSIIDVAGGSQPIGNEDNSIQIVYNGEIYNHRALHAELERRGHHFRTRSDTEAIVHAYEDDGDGCVHRLRGMFAFAIWDSRRARLLLARDRLGIKPLYYCPRPGGVAFASELRSLLTLPWFTPRLDRQAIAAYLSFGYVPDSLCIFAGVHKLPPGHVLSWDASQGCRVERYWSPVQPVDDRITEQDAVDELRRLLAESVTLHLESDVPLGAFLSGGIDSSTVVALMSRSADQRVRTFSIGFDDPAFNEAPHAARVARALGTEHAELVVRPNADALIEEVVRSYDEPFADSSALPTYLVSMLARQHVTVALSGDGGDELFGGYTRYRAALAQTELRAPTARRAVRSLARHLPHVSPGRNRLLDLARTRRGRYASMVANPLGASDGGIAHDEVAAASPPLDTLLDDSFDQVSHLDFATQMMVVDALSYLPGDILTKVDRASMAVSLEARVPLLDHVVAEFALKLPSALKIRNGDGKWVLRRAIEGLVPPEVLEHPKQGFAVPLVRWFRGPLRHRVEALRDPKSSLGEFVDARAVARVVTEHTVGRRDHSPTLWRLIALELWLQSLARGEMRLPLSPGSALFSVVRETVHA